MNGNHRADMSAKTTLNLPRQEPNPIAIIGMACRLPGDVHNTEQLWDLCAQARSAWTPFPESRFQREAFYHPDPDKRGCTHAQGGHFLSDDISLFDAPFFRITTQEAKAMDPQQRIMLECTYEALENAGLPLHLIAGRPVGVFAAQSLSEYGTQYYRDLEMMGAYKATGNSDSLLSNRVSYTFDLRGPSMTVDTACSSSLTALHLACQSIKARESTMAVVSGCHLLVNVDEFVSFSKARLLSPTGRCMAFDDRATSGFGRGEGVGSIILKPLEDALRDGDNVRAVIRNSGSNQDGKTAGITLPSRDAQASLIRAVYKSAGLDPRETGFVEAHGTGTAMGDPIEASAIGEVFRRPINTTPLYIGSLKSNIGHLEGTSGVASIIKTVLMLEKGFILPNCDFKTGNPEIPMTDWNMKVPSKQILWPRSKIRRASVNNFGFGGTNVHVILEQAPTRKAGNPDNNLASDGLTNGLISKETVANGMNTNGTVAKGAIDLQNLSAAGQIASNWMRASYAHKTRHLVVFSAADETAAKAQIASLFNYLQQRPPTLYRSLYERLVFTLQRHTQLQWRCALTVTHQGELMERMEDHKLRPMRTGRPPRLGFVFTGQGAQWYSMGRELIYVYPVFRKAISNADLVLERNGCPWSLFDEISKDQDTSLIDRADISQVACTAIQIALVDLLSSFDVRPSCVVGHSSGEIAGAYAAGVLTSDTCILLAYHRGKAVLGLRDRVPKIQGEMLAVGMGPADVDSLLKDFTTVDVVTACINSPTSVTLSGDQASIAVIAKACTDKGIFNRKLRTKVAYHSHHMALVAQEYHSKIKDLEVGKTSKVGFYSSLTGDKIDTSILEADYWIRNMTSPVLFSDAVRTLCHFDSVDVLLELGPHCALKGPIRQILSDTTLPTPKPEYMSTLVRFENSHTAILQTAAYLFVKGCTLEMCAVNFPVEDAQKPAPLQDLPTYPWNHSNRYWLESRISRAYRHPQDQRHDLLGIRIPECNDLEPQWRNVLRPESLPWLLQHKISGNPVFPMSGFIAMAIEAMRSHANSRGIRFSRYSLREVVLNQALIIPPSVDVEIMTTLRPANQATKGSSKTWNEIRIFSWTLERHYSEHCRCLIKVDGSTDMAANFSPGIGLKRKAIKERVVQNSSKAIDSKKLYTMIDQTDLEYGPLFQHLEDVMAGSDPDTAFGSLLAPDTAATMPYQYESDLVIHPVTLDMCFQISWPILTKAGTLATELHVPTYIKKLEIAANIFENRRNRLRLYGHRAPSDTFPNQQSTSFYAERDGESDDAFAFEAENFTVTSLGGNTSPPKESALVFKMSWQPHFRLLCSKQFQDLFPQSPLSQKTLESMAAKDKAALVFARRAVQQIQPEHITNMQKHHASLYSWLKGRVIHGFAMSRALQDDRTSEILSKSDEETIDYVRSECGPGGRFLCRIGEDLVSILTGKTDPLALMMEDDLLGEVYRTEEMGTSTYPQAAEYVSLLAHQNPHLKILEIGAGTCAATHSILPVIAGELGNHARFSKYVCTDISTGFFDGARQLLEPWASLLQFERLDIELDPREQGFAEAEFDLVIASNVLHATKNMENTMRNVRRLLKPSGSILLIEMTVMNLRTFMYGTLPGWWLGEEETRKDAPLLSETQWDATLKQCGFRGLELSLPDYTDEAGHFTSVMVSTAAGHEQSATGKTVVLITLNQETNQGLLADLKNDLTPMVGSVPEICTLQETIRMDLSETICISLIELDTPIFKELDQTRLEQIQGLCGSKGLLWVTRSATAKSGSPDTHLVQGLARSIRNEISSFRFITLDLEEVVSSGPSSRNIISEVFRLTFLTEDPFVEDDLEFMERNGIVFVPRITHDAEVEAYAGTYFRKPTPKMQSISHGNRQLVAKQGVEGSLSDFYFDDRDKIPEDDLTEDDVCVEVKATGLNFKDVMVALGQVTGSIGSECSGVVTKIGARVTNVALGDRVCLIASECLATSLRVAASSTVRIPDKMSFTDAASSLAVFSTAKYSLIDQARLQSDESVLIHAAAGGVGQAAILIAQMVGAEVFATVGSTEKKNFLIEKYGIPEDHIFSSRHLSFGEEIRQATANKGVDVVLNSLAGEFLRVGWGCLAEFGRFVEIGKRDMLENTLLEMGNFGRSLSFFFVDLVNIFAHNPRQAQRIVLDVMELFRNGMPLVSPVTVLPFHELENGFRMLQTAKVMGKIVFEHRVDDQVMVTPPKNRPNNIRANATYLLTGGSGGLGRSITKYLVQQGARHIVLASRQGPESAKAQALIEELANTGANIVPISCDIGYMENVRALVDHCEATLPPIRGVIHGAMVLEDMLFERTDAETYMRIMRPKIHGVWNLHSCLISHSLDFFVNLSSVAGIWGNRGQAVYGATSTALGAFAQWRTAQRMPTVTIHIGMVSEVGYLAEREDLMEALRKDSVGAVIPEREVLALVMTAIEGHASSPEMYTGFALERVSSRLQYVSDAKFSHIRRAFAQDAHHECIKGPAAVSLSRLLASASSLEAARQLMVDGLVQKLCSLLMLPLEDIDTGKPIAKLGLDSLVAVELRNWIAKEMEVSINLVDVMTASSLGALARLVGQRSRLVKSLN